MELEKLPSVEARIQRVSELASERTGFAVDLVSLKLLSSNFHK